MVRVSDHVVSYSRPDSSPGPGTGIRFLVDLFMSLNFEDLIASRIKATMLLTYMSTLGARLLF